MKSSALLFLLSVSVAAWAQVQEPGQTLTFKEAVKIGLENNMNLNQQRNLLFVNQSQVFSSYSNLAPSVSATAQAWKTLGNQFIEQEARVVNDASTNNFFGTIDANLTLFNGFNRINAIKETNSRLEAQQYLINRSRQDVISAISSQYLLCLLDEEAVKIEEKSLELQKNQLTAIQEQVRLGARPQIDEYNQEFQVKDAELRVLRAKNTLRNDKATLSNTLVIDPGINYVLSQPEWSVGELSDVPQSIEELYAIASANRADLLQAKELELATRKNMSVTMASTLPSLNAFLGLNSRYSDASAPSFNDQFSGNKRTQYGVQLNIPIFSNWQNRARYVQSKVNHENAKLTTKNTEVVVKNDVLRAFQNYKDALLAYEAGQSQLKAGENNFVLQKERYDLAASDLIQFIQANRDYVQAQTNFAQTKYTLMFQKILLDYATGTLKFEDIP